MSLPWHLLASALVATAPLGSAATETISVERFHFTGQVLIYEDALSGLPSGWSLRPAELASREDLLMNLEGHGDVTREGGDVLALATEPLFGTGARPLLVGPDGQAFDVGDLALGFSDMTGWELASHSEDLTGKPAFALADQPGTVNPLSDISFSVQGELFVHPDLARALHLPADATVGAITLRATTYPGQTSNAAALGAPGALATSGGPQHQVGGPIGPDVITSGVGSGINKYGTDGNVTAYAWTTISCNIGDTDAIWIDCVGGSNCNQHPVIGSQLYRRRTVDGAERFEMVGMSWLKHGWCAADAPSCGAPYTPDGSCDWLGLFATDTYGASLNGDQSDLGPRSEIQPWTGVFPYPYNLNWNQGGSNVFKRMQVLNSDLVGDADYYGEVVYIATDENEPQRYNNYSWRRINQGSAGNNPPYSNLSFSGSTIAQQYALQAWATDNPDVVLTEFDVPGDGRMVLGSLVTDLGGSFRYEYALFNMNSDRGARGLYVPEGTGSISNQGFHDVFYHSGEPYSGADWAQSISGGAINWSTQTFGTNVNANAVRWATTYNFRFDSTASPQMGQVEVELFKPGTPTSMMVAAPVPTGFACPAPVAYCPNNPNSTGVAATMGVFGSTSIADNNMTLQAFDLPGSTNGVFFRGTTKIDPGTPFGNGLQCVGGAVQRLGIEQAFGGVISQQQDLASPQWNTVVPGQTVFLQHWYRNVAGGGAGFNLSNAIELTLCN